MHYPTDRHIPWLTKTSPPTYLHCNCFNPGTYRCVTPSTLQVYCMVRLRILLQIPKLTPVAGEHVIGDHRRKDIYICPRDSDHYTCLLGWQ